MPKNTLHLTSLIAALLLTSGTTAFADTVGCVTTEWKLIGANHKVCVEAFGDAKVPGVTCHVSQARTGGVAGSLGPLGFTPRNSLFYGNDSVDAVHCVMAVQSVARKHPWFEPSLTGARMLRIGAETDLLPAVR